MKILLLHPGGLGDVILSLPAVALLRDKFPSARLTVAGNLDHLVPVLDGYAERVVSLSTVPLHNLYADTALPDSDMRFWRSFDQIISWTGSGDPGFVQKMKAICPDACIASWKPQRQETRHVSQLFIDSLGSAIALGRNAIHTPIRLSRELSAQGLHWLSEQAWRAEDPLVALHPGAGSIIKRWPLARFISLARHFTHPERKRLLIIEGPAERELAAQIKCELPQAGLMTAICLSLDKLAAIISNSALFIGNDSGMAHLAAGLGIHSIVLFGPTIPRHWAPLGSHVRVLWDTRNCAACSSGGGVHTCLENITVEDVLQTVECGSLLPT